MSDRLLYDRREAAWEFPPPYSKHTAETTLRHSIPITGTHSTSSVCAGSVNGFGSCTEGIFNALQRERSKLRRLVYRRKDTNTGQNSCIKVRISPKAKSFVF